MIDPHVHCRDWNQSHKETIKHALYVAEKAGLSAIFDMPNTDPAIISRELVEKRLDDARKCNSKVFYGLYIGITADKAQIREAVEAWKEYFPHNYSNAGVIGMKMFAGKSVGNLGIINEDEQKLVYKTLAEQKYSGVLAVHCEKESLMKPELFNPENPRTHSFARPPESEIESIEDQIKFAEEAGFEGTLHICHVSCPESVELIEKAREKMNITCAVTPHHCALNYEQIPESKEGLIYKVNPPLRNTARVNKMYGLLGAGKIDFIESDHAPHTLKEKLEDKISGFPGMPFYPHFIEELYDFYELSEQQIHELVHTNIESIFNIKIPSLDIKQPDFNLEKEYEFDVYTLK